MASFKEISKVFFERTHMSTRGDCVGVRFSVLDLAIIA